MKVCTVVEDDVFEEDKGISSLPVTGDSCQSQKTSKEMPFRRELILLLPMDEVRAETSAMVCKG